MPVSVTRFHCRYFTKILSISLMYMFILFLSLKLLTSAGKEKAKMITVIKSEGKQFVKDTEVDVKQEKLYREPFRKDHLLVAISEEEMRRNSTMEYLQNEPVFQETKKPTNANTEPFKITTARELSNQTKALFSPTITETEKMMLKKLLNAFIKTVPSTIAYFMCGGTRLGSYRHHGMLPWDDDIDLVVREKDKHLLLKSLSSLHPYFEVDTSHTHLWKFYHYTSKPTGIQWGAWPFIDIFFFVENETFIWQSGSAGDNIHEKKYVFPLVERPFMGLQVFAPKNTYEVLRKYNDISVCVSNTWNHREERKTPVSVQVPCDLLKDTIPIVKRLIIKGKTVEILDTENGTFKVVGG